MHAEYFNPHHILAIRIGLNILSSEVPQEVSRRGADGFQQPAIDLVGDLILYIGASVQ